MEIRPKASEMTPSCFSTSSGVDLAVMTLRRDLMVSISVWDSWAAYPLARSSSAVSASKREESWTPIWLMALFTFSSMTTSLRWVEMIQPASSTSTSTITMIVIENTPCSLLKSGWPPEPPSLDNAPAASRSHSVDLARLVGDGDTLAQLLQRGGKLVFQVVDERVEVAAVQQGNVLGETLADEA